MLKRRLDPGPAGDLAERSRLVLQLMRPDLEQGDTGDDPFALVAELQRVTGANSADESNLAMLALLNRVIPFASAAVLQDDPDRRDAFRVAAFLGEEIGLDLSSRSTLRLLRGLMDGNPQILSEQACRDASVAIGTDRACKSVLVSAFQTWQHSGIILCLHPESDFFSQEHLRALETFVPLAAQTTQRVEQINELHALVDQLDFLAHHDALTGLPNRMLFHKRLSAAFENRGTAAAGIALLMIDLDHFKEINDTYGHPVGDEVLREVAFRLRRASPRKAFVSRIAGDEFAMIVSDADGPDEIGDIVEDIYRRLRMPVLAGLQPIAASLTIGVALAPSDGTRPDELVGNADLALYRAKRDGRGTVRYFDRALDCAMAARREIATALRRAIADREFCNFYQPQYDLSTGRLVGYEALLRWNDPRQGLRMPGEFIPVAEETGLICDLGEWAMIKACTDAARWPSDLHVAVNLSPIQLRQGNIRQTVERALAQSGLAPHRLEIEVTENILITDTERAVDLLKTIQSLGVGIAMDDFGTGFSSLSYLARFPFNKIKVDRSFVSNLGSDPHVDAIVASIMGLGRSINIPIIAEGIETEDQLAHLKAAGCQFGQGFLFGHPQPLDDAAQGTAA